MLAYITLLPIAILVGFVTLIVFKRELHTVSTVHVCLVRLWACQMFTPSYFALQISFFAGLILNEVVNWVFKHILREPRPCAGR